MVKKSAGILLYRYRANVLEFFLVHPGGPFWAKKDQGAWSIPKGEVAEDEDLLQAARREFLEETGQEISGDFMALEPIRLKSGKIIYAFAIGNDLDEKKLLSNTFPLEWPPKSGKIKDFPEIDKGAWFDLPSANEKINEAQRSILSQLSERISR